MKKLSQIFFVLFIFTLSACTHTEPNLSEENKPTLSPKYAKLHQTIQNALDEIVESGEQNAVQCCIYIKGELAVDAYSGYYTKSKERKIDGDSLFPIYSTEKPIFATAINRAVEMGKLHYDMKISSIWKEFGCNGKENITLRHIITHHSGLKGDVDKGTTHEQYCDWNYMANQCANFKLITKPGTYTHYLSRTYAWLLGEPLARAMQLPIRDALKELVLIPAGIEKDFYFGIDDTVPESRCVEIYNKSEKSRFAEMNMPIHRKACVPSSNAMASARAIAKFYARLIGLDGNPPLLKPETFKEATTPYLGKGETLNRNNGKWNPVWGCGYILRGNPPAYNNVVGQSGFGGSIGWIDTHNKIAFAYTCSNETDVKTNTISKKIENAVKEYFQHKPFEH